MMNRVSLGAPLALLFLAVIVPSQAQTPAEAEIPVVTVAAGAAWELACPLRVESPARWRRMPGGAAPPAELARGERAAGARLLATLSAPAARPQHAGTYECGAGADQRLRLRVLPAAAPHAAAAGTRGRARALGEADESVVYYDIYKKFQLNCTLPNPEPRNDVLWFKNDTLVSAVGELKDRYKTEGDTFALTAKSTEEDYGLYACAIRPGPDATAEQLAQAPKQTFDVRGRAHSKLPADSNVVEEQTLKLVCKVSGKPTETVSWHYRQELDGNETTVQERFGDRVNTTQVNATATLTLKEAVRSDAGFYSCNVTGISGATQVRVKDMYAALWPFLGICAEVFILCAIILVYERRRTKPELDDSDTDNHEQKKS